MGAGHSKAKVTDEMDQDPGPATANEKAVDFSSGTNRNDSSASLAKSETRNVKLTKFLVLGSIVVAAASLATVVYLALSQQEQATFQVQFRGRADELVKLVQHEARELISSVESASFAISSMVTDRNETWPFVTIPRFELQGSMVNHLVFSEMLTFIPLVRQEVRAEWEAYAATHQDWINESLVWGKVQGDISKDLATRGLETPLTDAIWRYENGKMGERIPAEDSNNMYGLYAPVWQQSPVPIGGAPMINFDILSDPLFQRIYHGVWEGSTPVFTGVTTVNVLANGIEADQSGNPKSYVVTPVRAGIDAVKERQAIVGLLVTFIRWKNVISQAVAHHELQGLRLVLSDSCGESYTFTTNGTEAAFEGVGDLHDGRYSNLRVNTSFTPFEQPVGSEVFYDVCQYHLFVYPTLTHESSHRASTPAVYAVVIVVAFALVALTVLFYDYTVQRRQNHVMEATKRTNAIVTSLFPANVRDRILMDMENQVENDFDYYKNLDADNPHQSASNARPIADLYPDATILFADIVGFTAWSSVREPAQVFTLLETLFAAFDEIAETRGVFKVETVGDCYVAATGLPEPCKNHPVVMARFARDILFKMNDLTKALEVTLGPDTGDLALRIGIHSGQVTAGVLRGGKSRFQLFGDTMNTCARIESTGKRNKIHASAETASLLTAMGKGYWVQERTDIIAAKGKGYMQTYWLNFHTEATLPASTHGIEGRKVSNEGSKPNSGATQSVALHQVEDDEVANARTKRLIDWNVDVLKRFLQQIQARRLRLGNGKKTIDTHKGSFGGSIVDEVKEIITLPNFNSKLGVTTEKDLSELDVKAVEQLNLYITAISKHYKRENPFHCFEHASHVTMSVVKLLSRIVAPDNNVGSDADKSLALTMHDHTYGITSDPLTQFACIFAALIHDVQHEGVPNTQLIKENASVASMYKNKSVAEQNSLDVSWKLLMEAKYTDLRAAIYRDETEFLRFRQLLVNAVMATDIMDKDASTFRKQRWEKAFSEQSDVSESPVEANNRKATIVIEHLIQASDVAHTMQHWHIYSKWNERLFDEMNRAFKEGRAEKDPAENWYQGEIGFFDFYVIPLAKKLKACGVFGVSSDEYLNYALANRKEWEARGKDRVEAMVAKYNVEKK